LGTLLRTIGFVNKEVTDQADYLRRLNSPTSNVTKNIKNLTVATVDETDKTEKSNKAKEKAAAAAKKQADAYAKMKAAAAEAAQVIQDKLNAQLDDATSKLDAAQKSFDDFSRTVGSAVTESFNFGQAQAEAADNVADLKDALDVTGKPLTFLDSLEKQAQKAKNFGVLVNRLIAGGLSEAALTQVLAAGTTSGTLIAEEILGSADGILRTNTLTEAMTALSNQLGNNAATKFYNAGVTAAQSYLAGIQSQLGIAPAAISSGGFSFDFASLLAGVSVGGLGTLMADGGVVTRATTITAGEAGPEAIIPLDRMKDFGMGGGNSVTINVNGGDPQAVVQALRTYMRQNGSVPIRVSNIY
jgi:flavodoxin